MDRKRVARGLDQVGSILLVIAVGLSGLGGRPCLAVLGKVIGGHVGLYLLKYTLLFGFQSVQRTRQSLWCLANLVCVK